jgi:hypothetical protein
VAVLVVWWVGLPLLCLLLGDVMRAINPFVGVTVLLDRRRRDADDLPTGPTWLPAGFLLAFSWYFLAYYRPGSPRALATFLIVYSAAAVAAGLRWGPTWLSTGEAFGGISNAVARLGLRRPRGPLADGTLLLMVVWMGGTIFDAFTNTPFWVDVLGTSRGWTRTMLNSVGLLWMTAIAGGLALLVLRVGELGSSADRRPEPKPPSAGQTDSTVLTEAPVAAPALTRVVGWALVPLALGWFLAHDLTLLLFEGQNFYALLSDPLGRGWDVFGTLHHTIDYGIVLAGWVRWAQLGLLAVGHVAALVLLHDGALRLMGRRSAMRTTWTMAAIGSTSIAAAALMVL